MFDRSAAAYSSRAKAAAAKRAALGRNRNQANPGHPTTSERLYSQEETEFLLAMEEFKRTTGRRFPTWSEALGVMRGLGYVRVAGGNSLHDHGRQCRRAS